MPKRIPYNGKTGNVLDSDGAPTIFKRFDFKQLMENPSKAFNDVGLQLSPKAIVDAAKEVIVKNMGADGANQFFRILDDYKSNTPSTQALDAAITELKPAPEELEEAFWILVTWKEAETRLKASDDREEATSMLVRGIMLGSLSMRMASCKKNKAYAKGKSGVAADVKRSEALRKNDYQSIHDEIVALQKTAGGVTNAIRVWAKANDVEYSTARGYFYTKSLRASKQKKGK